MCSTGDCFVVLPPHSATGSIIFGRNSNNLAAVKEAQEVIYYNANEAVEGKSDGGAEPEYSGDTFRIIIQKPRPGVWGGDCGANEKNVCIGISYTNEDVEAGSGHLLATDILRYVLATANSAEHAVERLGELIEAHSAADHSFIVCDTNEVWAVSCSNKLWAAHCIKEGFHRFPMTSLNVQNKIDKSSPDLGDALKAIAMWDGEMEINFAELFGGFNEEAWSGDEPVGDGNYTLTSMFETLRSASKSDSSRSATVFSLASNGISCYWFTATPNASESVFKPFVFAPQPKISPLTSITTDNTITLLHKLHAQRKSGAVDNLKNLEASCVDEVNKYLAEHPEADEELDELMKDCVEAEVKFYR